jgi:hypothetical protein
MRSSTLRYSSEKKKKGGGGGTKGGKKKQRLLRQYLHFCTSKASKLSTERLVELHDPHGRVLQGLFAKGEAAQSVSQYLCSKACSKATRSAERVSVFVYICTSTASKLST